MRFRERSVPAAAMSPMIGVALLALIMMTCGCADTSEEDRFAALRLVNVILPPPAEEGDLCVRFETPLDLRIDDLRLTYDDPQGESIHSFGPLFFEPGRTIVCTNVCLCGGDDGREIFIAVDQDESTRTWSESFQGCCG